MTATPKLTKAEKRRLRNIQKTSNGIEQEETRTQLLVVMGQKPEELATDANLLALFDRGTLARILQAFGPTPLRNQAAISLYKRRKFTDRHLKESAAIARLDNREHLRREDPEAKRALALLAELGSGPYQTEDVLRIREDLADTVGKHTTCWSVRATMSKDMAEDLLITGPGSLPRYLPKEQEALASEQITGALHISKAALDGYLFQLNDKTITHRGLHDLLEEQARDPKAFAHKLDIAKRERRVLLDQKALDAAKAREERKLAQDEKRALLEKANNLRLHFGLQTRKTYPEHVRTIDAAEILGISPSSIRYNIKNGNLHGEQYTVSTNYGNNDLWFIDIFELEKIKNTPPPWLIESLRRGKQAIEKKESQEITNKPATKAAPVRSNRPPTKDHRSPKKKAVRPKQIAIKISPQAKAAVHVNLPLRKTLPLSMEAHLGPTNSGKTYDAIRALMEAGEGVYAAPLRALAMEVYLKLSNELGEEAVGLITGEEQINPKAPIICCTPECAPMKTHLLVLDEVHWIEDEDRGWAWARLLSGMEVEHLILIGAGESETLLKEALGDKLVVTHHKRLTPITYKGNINPKSLKKGTLVVAFSRKAVLALARHISEETRWKVGALYGMMPPLARREVIRDFMEGETDILVVTDVIGHGINLPAKTVVMAETEKFDGYVRRPLHLWEAAQILGRAGRYNLSGEGETYTLVNSKLGLTTNGHLVEQATQVAMGGKSSGLAIKKGELRATLADLDCPRAELLPEYLLAWSEQATVALHAHPWLKSKGVHTLLTRLDVITKANLQKLSVEGAWKLLTLPVDNPERLLAYTEVVIQGGGLRIPQWGNARNMDLQEAENAAALARDTMAFTRAFGDGLGVSHEDCRLLEQAACAQIIKLLPDEVKENTYGICNSCSKPCPPWFDTCQSCYNSRGSYGYDFDNWW